MWQLLVAMTLTMGMSQNPPKLNIGLLEELCNAFGPSGFEREVQQIIRDRGQPFADEVLFDGTGSVIFKRVGTPNDTRRVRRVFTTRCGLEAPAPFNQRAI